MKEMIMVQEALQWKGIFMVQGVVGMMLDFCTSLVWCQDLLED